VVHAHAPPCNQAASRKLVSTTTFSICQIYLNKCRGDSTMPVNLRPTIGRGGLIKLDRLAVFLYAFWFLQFAIAVYLDYLWMYWWVFYVPNGFFFVLSNFLLTITLFVEANVFAKGALTPNRFLCFEVFKTSYMAVLFIWFGLPAWGEGCYIPLRLRPCFCKFEIFILTRRSILKYG
jgi:hypothetical protein